MSDCILAIEPYKGKTWVLKLQSGDSYFLAGEIASQFHLHPGDCLTPEQLSELLTAEQTRKAYQRALYLLDLRAYSYQELFQKLEQTYPEEVCYSVLSRLCSQNLINDARYAESLAHHYVSVKRLGMRRARFELTRRGIAPETALEALEPYEEEMPRQCREVLLQKYSRLLRDPDDRKSIEKAKAGMVRLGYSHDTIRDAIREALLACLDDLEPEEE